jgi:hypothetical protein
MIELSSKQLRRAANVKDQIDKLQRELSRLLGGEVGNGRRATAKAAPKKRKRRKKMSAATRAVLSAKLKAAWAKRKARKK